MEIRSKENQSSSFGSRLLASLKLLLLRFPVTPRGLLFAALSVIGLKHYGLEEDDLVISMLGGCFLSAFILLGLYLLVVIRKKKKRLSVTIVTTAPELTSKVPLSQIVKIEHGSLPPALSLRLSRLYSPENIESQDIIVSGRSVLGGSRQLEASVSFPHRGLWTLSEIELQLRDVLGFFSLSWKMPVKKDIEVLPPRKNIRPLPIVATSSHSGEEFADVEERSGDLYDIKPYDPSDGVNRILWKTYARSRELVVRRPEPAIVPEGELVVYLVASKNDDHVAAALISYLEQLQQANITIIFGTDGIDYNALASPISRHADIREAMLSTVWNKNAGTGKDFASFVRFLERRHIFARQIVVFTGQAVNSISNNLASVDSSGLELLVVTTEENSARSYVKEKKGRLTTLRESFRKKQRSSNPVIGSKFSSHSGNLKVISTEDIAR